MRRFVPSLAIAVSLVIALSGCSLFQARTTTDAPAPASAPPRGVAAVATIAPGLPAVADKITIEAFDLGFTPAMVMVPAAGTYQVEFKNARGGGALVCARWRRNAVEAGPDTLNAP